MEAFVKAWRPLFEKHYATLVTVWDGEEPEIHVRKYPKNVDDGRRPYCEYSTQGQSHVLSSGWLSLHRDLFCRRTDGCRNIGFAYAAKFLDFDRVLTFDDDVHPAEFNTTPQWWKGVTDPIQEHLDALDRRVPLSWMNTAHDTDLYLRGVPYGVRDEAPVMLSHGVWVGTPDFDGETQLLLEAADKWECGCGCTTVVPGSDDNPIKCAACGRPAREGGRPNRVPHSLPYYVGPIPRGVNFPLCGMNVMVKRDALPYLYYAPMGADSGFPDLHRFADIFMGVFLKREFDRLGWGVVTGYSTVHHTRASDAKKNYEQEKLGREWMEHMTSFANEGFSPDLSFEMYDYMASYADKRTKYADLIRSLLNNR